MKGARLKQLALTAFAGSLISAILAGGCWYWVKTPLLPFFTVLSVLTAIQAMVVWGYGFLLDKVETEEQSKGHLDEEGLLSEQLFDQSTRHQAAFKTYKGMGGSLCALTLGTVLIFAGIWVFRWLEDSEIKTLAGSGAGAAAILGIISISFILGGSYLSGCFDKKSARWLKPVSEWFIFSATFGLIGAIELVIEHFSLLSVNFTTIIIKIAVIILMVTGVEILLQVLLNLFRPSHERDVAVFESRLLGLLVFPTKLWEQLAETVNYQLGYEATDKQHYRRGAILLGTLIGLQLVGWLAGTTFYELKPGEYAMCMQMGKCSEIVEEAGIHLKMPWPFEKVEKVNVGKVRMVDFGGSRGEEPELVKLWQNQGKNEKLYLIDGKSEKDLNLVHLSGTVWYRVINPAAYYLWSKDSEDVLKKVINREITRTLLQTDAESLAGKNRLYTENFLEDALQHHLNTLKSGISVTGVSLIEIRTPSKVLTAYSESVTAKAEAEQKIAEGKAEEELKISLAKAKASVIVENARAFKKNQQNQLDVLKKAFEANLQLFQISPELYEIYRTMEIISKADGVRKIIHPAGLKPDISLNLEEHEAPEILSTIVPEESDK